MNEFTKQELEQLSFAIYTYPHPDDDHIYQGLRKKIKAMIDNYCEHETSNNSYCPGLYAKVIADKEIIAKDLVRIYECDKCGEYYKESLPNR